MKFTAEKLAGVLGGSVEGDPQAVASTFGKIEHGKEGQLCFYANPKYESYVYTCKASILLVKTDFQPKSAVTPTLVRVPDPYNALSQLLDYVAKQGREYRRHRGRCRIAPSAKLGKKVWVGDFVTIGAKVTIGDRTKIYDNVTIGAGTKIGEDCIIYPGVHIFPGMVIGDRVILHAGCIIGDDGFGNAKNPDGTWKKIEHLGNVIIGNDVEVGSNTTIDKAPMESTIIKDGVRIDNLCQIAHNVVVGENSAMAAQTGIAGSAVIGKNVLLGGQVGVIGHITVADGTCVGAKSSIAGNVRKPDTVLVGNPGFDKTQFLKAYAKFKASGNE